MSAAIVMVAIILVPVAVVFILGVFSLIAEYSENPVIELVEEYRKKYSHTNENYQLSLKGTHHVQLDRTRRDHPEDPSLGPH